MAHRNGVVVRTCHELASGDAVEAFYNNVLVHRGPVLDVIPECGLLWILDTVTGCCRLLETTSGLEIYRLDPPGVAPRAGRFLPNSHRPAGGRGTPSSYWRDVSPRRK